MNDIKLLPCPFCGEVGEITDNSPDDQIDGIPSSFQINCFNYDCDCGQVEWYLSAEAAAAKWNRRSLLKAKEIRDLLSDQLTKITTDFEEKVSQLFYDYLGE